MSLIDEVQLDIKAGKGGDGVVRWIREKFKPKGGPGGGNGGRGGDVIAVAVADLAALDDYRHKKDFKAQNGEPGGNYTREGKNGEHLHLRFPVGSVLTNTETGETTELTKVGEQIVLLRGGRGGLGNEYFKSSTNQAPEQSTPGKPGQTGIFDVELQLIADAGLIGLPSAGKSTLLNSLTNAKSKTAEYHFTTLDPHLGKFYEFILADIPGLIEGASDGKGLGHKFLRHIRRTNTLVHLVSLENEDIIAVYDTIRKELQEYDPSLLDKQEIIVLSKVDMLENPDELEQKFDELKKHSGAEHVFVMSAYDDASIKALSDELVKILRG